jgi:NADH-quinone oxidoreductase subunit H
MKFSMFFIAEYANMVTASALMITLFFGGWSIPFCGVCNSAPWAVWKTLVTLGFFFVKLLFFLFLFMWIRWTLPRFRYDQLMSLGWKFMLPLALAYIVVMAGAMLVLDMLGVPRGQTVGHFLSPYWAILGVLNIVLAIVVFVIIDRGNIVSPAYKRVGQRELQRLRAMSVPSAIAPVTTRDIATQGD